MTAYMGLAQCQMCWAINDHVEEQKDYIGGYGYVRRMRCRDHAACQLRVDAKKRKDLK
jgi:hypothetical protein